MRYPLPLNADEDLESPLPILDGCACFYEYVLVDGRRITPLSNNLRKSAGSSIIKVLWDGDMFAGEVLSFFHHDQPCVNDKTLFAEVKWLKHLPDTCAAAGDPWFALYVQTESIFVFTNFFLHVAPSWMFNAGNMISITTTPLSNIQMGRRRAQAFQSRQPSLMPRSFAVSLHVDASKLRKTSSCGSQPQQSVYVQVLPHRDHYTHEYVSACFRIP